MPDIKAPFYGHVRQYHSIKKEIDDAILSVLESNQYVMGPALKQFEQDLARYFGTKHAVGVNSGHGRPLARLPGPGHQARGRDHHHRQHLLRDRGSHLDRAGEGGLRGLRPPDQQHRSREDRGRHHPEDAGHRARAPLRPLRRHEGGQRDRAEAQAVRGGGQRAGHRRPRAGLEAGSSSATPSASASSSRRTWARSATAARWSRTVTTSTRPCAGCATTDRPRAPSTAWATTAVSTTSTRPSWA